MKARTYWRYRRMKRAARILSEEPQRAWSAGLTRGFVVGVVVGAVIVGMVWRIVSQ